MCQFREMEKIENNRAIMVSDAAMAMELQTMEDQSYFDLSGYSSEEVEVPRVVPKGKGKRKREVDEYVPSDKTCSICLCDMESSEVKIKLPCGHVYHSKCMRKWKRKICPVDRKTFTVGSSYVGTNVF